MHDSDTDNPPGSIKIGRSAEVLDRLHARYPQAQYRFVEFITEHLTDCSRTFGGDLVEMLVLALVGQSHINAHIARDAGEETPPAEWISATSIADICGLSRETVRRKLKGLAAREWIEQLPGGGWRIAMPTTGEGKARLDLDDLDRRGIKRLAQLFTDIEPLVKK